MNTSVFHHTSKKCHDWLQAQPQVREESLTDWLLYNVSQSTDRFYYKTFNKHEESINGSDWEWWVVFGGPYGNIRAFRFLVQAKKLKKKNNYQLICYGNRHGLQIDLLIEAARKRNAMPLYMFYSV